MRGERLTIANYEDASDSVELLRRGEAVVRGFVANE